MAFFGVVKCNLEYDYFVALMDVCSKDKFLGYDWCHLNSFLETCDPPINSTRCPSNRHATFVVPSFDPERPFKKNEHKSDIYWNKNCPNPLGKTVNYDKTTSFHDWDLGWFVGAVYQKNKRVCRINRVNLRCNSWWILCYFTAKKNVGAICHFWFNTWVLRTVLLQSGHVSLKYDW